jgi:hypothetical protein
VKWIIGACTDSEQREREREKVRERVENVVI